MMWETRTGTRSELAKRRHKTPTPAKTALRSALAERKEWADRYCVAIAETLGTAAREIANLNLASLSVGKTYRWAATDDYTGVEFVFEIERIE